MSILSIAIIWAGAGQLLLIPANIALPIVMGWRTQLARVDPLLRDIVYIHHVFIAVTVLLFGVISVCFARDLAAPEHPLTRVLAGGIGFFWLLRLLLQWVGYDRAHWRGRPGRSVAQYLLSMLFAGWAAAYLGAALAGGAAP